ncbi:MAG TPA: bifunctional diguanylate cyclase/phosphodiesterase [Acidimicrobiales bacterium]|nr:bifunctional diguanylate cyclase/phosphodiesterase [Acidimicrobiales bacterium]
MGKTVDALFSDGVGGDNLGEVLAGALRLLSGAVAVEYVPASTAHTPIVWADLTHAATTAALHTAVSERLTAGGPWGAAMAGSNMSWIEPTEATQGPAASAGDDRDTGSGAGAEGERVSTGAFAVAFRERPPLAADEIETVRLFARLANAVTAPGVAPQATAKQRRLDDLVSTISERLMSTTGPTLRLALDWAVEVLCQFLGADVAFLRRNDHARGMSVLMAFYPPRGLPLEEDPLGIVPFDSDPIFAATKDLKVPFIVRNAAETDDRYLQRVRDAGGPDEFTGAGVPLVHGDTTEGVLAFVYLTPYTWSEHEINALRAVAALLVQLLRRVDAEERLRHSALTDDLTGLANRRALLEEVTNRSLGNKGALALLFIDLDRFKVMNDQLGHRAGDKVLQVIADRIRTSLRPTDFAARLGGDEFVVVLGDADGGLGAVAAANRLLDLIALPIDLGGQRVAHTGSVGIAITEGDSLTAEELLGQADIALYAAKSHGRSRAVVFDHELEASVAQRSTIELLLRQALDEDALRVMYQPEFDLATGRLLGVEALVRWFRSGEGFVEAAKFVPIAEETHLITDIDRWVLEEACKQLASWRRTYGELDLVMRVNMSPAQLGVSGIVGLVADCLRRSGLPPELLCLEITEQAVIADVDQAVQVLEDIRAMGVKLAIDDFGTGFSSMSQLKSLPVDCLKIDRTFVDHIAHDPTDQAIVDTIVRLARAFELDVVGEGIETMEDLSTLLRLGCRRGQGYLLARPLPPDEVGIFIERGGIDLTTLESAEAALASGR